MVEMRTGVEARLKPSPTAIAVVPFRWDLETEILTGSVGGLVAAATSHCTIELEDSLGAVVSLDVADGYLCGVEVVVWPKSDIIPNLRAPDATREAGLFLPVTVDAELPILEVETTLSCELAPDESVIHLIIGQADPSQSVAIGKNLLIDIDATGMLAGVWLLNVPPFGARED